MSLLNNSISNNQKNPYFISRVRSFLVLNPEWWVWFFCSFIWLLLLVAEIMVQATPNSSMRVLVCSSPNGVSSVSGAGSILKESAFEQINFTILSRSMIFWLIMICAMMYPLLRTSIRHVTRSVRRKDQELGILLFLIGYLLIWVIVGPLYVAIPYVLDEFLSLPAYGYSLLAAFILVVVAYRSWQPSREVVMMQCEATVPIRLTGWKFAKDSVFYGFKIGWACVKMCWLAMLALTLGHHSFVLMAIFTAIVIFERYYVAHDSKRVGYAWLGLTSVLLLGLLF